MKRYDQPSFYVRGGGAQCATAACLAQRGDALSASAAIKTLLAKGVKQLSSKNDNEKAV